MLVLTIVFLLAGICFALVLGYRKQVFNIMQLHNQQVTKKLETLRDYKKIYSQLKRNKLLVPEEKRLLRQHLILTFTLFLLYLTFVILLIFSNWH
jgi:hypothetical protein